MNTIWFLSNENNLLISGFNKIQKNGISELWITEISGSSRKIAKGKKADELENALLEMVWNNFPAIITDGNDKFATNININNEEEEEVE